MLYPLVITVFQVIGNFQYPVTREKHPRYQFDQYSLSGMLFDSDHTVKFVFHPLLQSCTYIRFQEGLLKSELYRKLISRLLQQQMGCLGKNILMNICQPHLRFCCPSYYCHVLILCSIVSLEIKFPFLESCNPLATIRSNTISLKISS